METCLLDPEEFEHTIELMPHQQKVLEFLGNGKILYGAVGIGKSAVAMAYYIQNEAPRDIYVITTAKKRDSLEWVGEAANYAVGTTRECTTAGVLTVDSWNNLGKYLDVKNAFFIFDEQRLVGHGAWVKNFLKIVRNGNRWILLTATPGDSWIDYAPVFIANGFYKNITDFKRQHVLYEPYVKFPRILAYVGESRLERLRNEILVEMQYEKHTTRYLNFMSVGYDESALKALRRNRWNPWTDSPIKDAAELWRLCRRVTNEDPSRLETIRFLLKFHPKLIIFYTFDYELEILRTLEDETDVAEWNGHRKFYKMPETDSWVYLVQYTSGAEGWNCVETDAMVLYSLTYSYKNYIQSMGRIDRLNTNFVDLFYYVLISGSFVDVAVKRALDSKKNFNERNEIERWI